MSRGVSTGEIFYPATFNSCATRVLYCTYGTVGTVRTVPASCYTGLFKGNKSRDQRIYMDFVGRATNGILNVTALVNARGAAARALAGSSAWSDTGVVGVIS
jgi:hypothetical protein